ncbi:MAG: AbrB family transcriptional regulator, partial [Pseudomonadota bacterium]
MIALFSPFARNWPLFPAGLVGGFAAYAIGLPMPFMLGAILGAGLMVALIERRAGPADLRLPKLLRESFIALIGTMIGASFTPDLLQAMPAFWPSVLAILVFIAVAQVVGYTIMRRLGGYSPADALYASMPGGLIEAAILGEKAGADPKLVSIQHFIRIMLVVFSVPILFWVATGEAVGSAAGESLAQRSWLFVDLFWIVVVAACGLWVGKRVRMPASHMIGPMIVSAALHAGDLLHIAPPDWAMHLAQFVVGVGLGAQFSGLTPGMLRRSLWVGTLAVTAMLAVTLCFAIALAPVVPASFGTMFLAFAPGGVTEMSLIALSLAASPVIVAVHHFIRIVCTVFITQAIKK